MAFDIRPATADEMGGLGTLGGYAYGGVFGDGPEALPASANRPEWTLCAFDGPVMAASFVTIPFTVRMNGQAMPFGGVSAVATRPDYRRRGLQRRLMTEATERMRDAGQSIAGLWASQAAIYQRYGYAIGSYRRTYTVDTVDIAFHDGDTGTGDVRWLEPADAIDVIKSIYIDFVAKRSVYLHRSGTTWKLGVLSPPAQDGPASVGLSYGPDGEPNGYVVYTLRGDRGTHPARDQELIVRDLVWLDLDGYRSLWTFLASHDLAGRVVWADAPIDDPAAELFAEPRMLNAIDNEGTWFRVVDVEPALRTRGYTTGGHATIAVVPDSLTPWNAGTYAVESNGEATSVERIAGDGDVTVSIKSLASLFTGLRSARQLASWGLLDGDDQAIGRIDSLFATRSLPHCPDHY